MPRFAVVGEVAPEFAAVIDRQAGMVLGSLEPEIQCLTLTVNQTPSDGNDQRRYQCLLSASFSSGSTEDFQAEHRDFRTALTDAFRRTQREAMRRRLRRRAG
ncbi:MAG: hypothetical protein NXH85_09135 [Pseudomonadaceae bacterium]|nr:hypothetical protein [Pseudomonadaceae bacterium]